MRDEQHRLPLFVPDALQLQVHLFARHRVERAEGLVHQQQARSQQQGAADRNPLLHAAAELAGIVIVEPLEPHEPDELACDWLILRARPAGGVRRDEHIVQHGAPLEQRGRLEYHPDTVGRLVHRDTVNAHLARARGQQAGHDLHERRLAAATRSHDGHELARRDVERRAAQRLPRARPRRIDLLDVPDFDERAHQTMACSPPSAAAHGVHTRSMARIAP